MKCPARLTMYIMISAIAGTCNATELVGQRTCRLWLVHKGRTSEISWTQIAAQQWLAGYLSGLATGTGVDALKDVNMEAIYMSMDNFCRANPTMSLKDGGDRIFDDLRSKRAAN